MIQYNNLKQQLMSTLYKGFSSSLIDMIKFEPHGKNHKMTQVLHHVNPDKGKPKPKSSSTLSDLLSVGNILSHGLSKNSVNKPMDGYEKLNNLILYNKESLSDEESSEVKKLKQFAKEKIQFIKQLLTTPAYKDYHQCHSTEEAWDHLGGNGDFGGDDPYDQWEDGLTPHEYQSVVAYCGSKWTYVLNSWLRGLPNPKESELPLNNRNLNIIKTIAKHLDSAISKFVIKKPLVVHRQLHIDTLQRFMSVPNGIFQDDGFISTTPVVGSFNLGNGVKKLDMVIKLPAGKGVGAWIAPMSGMGGENELLLARGTQFKITSVKVKKDENGSPISALMEVTVLGHKSKKLEEPTKGLDYDTFVSETEDSGEE